MRSRPRSPDDELEDAFEQSITELERMTAEAHGRAPARRGAQRKRNGVYYTPAWITAYIVEQTIGRKLQDIRRELDISDTSPVDDLGKLDAYASRIDQLTVLDAACGAGAFLIQALQRLVQERRSVAATQARLDPQRPVLDDDSHVRATLAHNLYGVDISTESVERTKLVLSLHTAQPDEPLAALDHTIRVGNSLIDDAFNWRDAFPEVFARGGFDCIVGNPPYVKFQNLRAVDPVLAEHLRAATHADGRRIYESTKSGNFDLYIPFIEKSLRLLNDSGRMGLIAPSLWIKQAYGQPLRTLIRAGKQLERWVDFGDFQVFRDATTYSALQFYTAAQNSAVQYVELPSADLSDATQDSSKAALLAYDELPRSGPWTFVEPEALRLITRLQARFPPLADSVASISVGVQTSADKIYHFVELAPGTYRNDHGTFEFEHFMRPLVSGEDVRRYAAPAGDRRILFPYVPVDGKVVLAPAAELRRRAPAVWRYLQTHAAALQARERGKFDDERWYRFGRSQNIDKQHLAKILVPRLVQHLGVSPDLDGACVADNVDVCYVIPRSSRDVWYLVGVLNSSLVDFMFRNISKPFRGDYRSANKQYIAPLPIPELDAEHGPAIKRLAKQLWTAMSKRRDERANITQIDAKIRTLDAELDAHVAALYGLSEAERALVAGACMVGSESVPASSADASRRRDR